MNRNNSFRIFYSLFIVIFCFTLIGCKKEQSQHQGELHVQTLPEKVDFNFHIKPILSDRCYACHGPDEKARKANLRLDTKEGAFALIDSSDMQFAIVPGDLKNSHLVSRIESKDSDFMMPPPESNLVISEFEIQLIKRWIKQGAEWKPHWAFTPPVKPKQPEVNNEDWPINSIDYFTLAKMTAKGLSPSPVAEKAKLIRRLSFDLTGLPPSIEEINAFLQSDTPDAYEDLVDQLLDRKSFGERMAMEWMDLARYADSHGYQDDIERSMWPWRDWVIDAFNQNMPYDQFVSWQLAGDLLPNSTYEQTLATGFNRNHKITQEVGVIDEEYRVTYVLDRVNTFSTAFLGLTVECAQCHDHKYDPISQKEYYSLYSFFNNVPEKGRVDYGVEVAEPFLPLPEEKAEKIREFIDNLFVNQQNEAQKFVASKWSKGFQADQLQLNNNAPMDSPKGIIAYYPLDYLENEETKEIIQGNHAQVNENLIPIPGKYSGGVEFMGANHARFDAPTKLNFNRPFSLSFWIKSLDGGISGPIISGLAADPKNPNFGIQITSEKNISFFLKGLQPKSLLSIKSKETIPENEWTNVILTYDGSKKVAGVNIFINGKELLLYTLKDKLRDQIPAAKELYLGILGPASERRGLVAGQLDEILFFNKKLDTKEITQLFQYNPLAGLIAKSNKTEIDQKRLFFHQLLHQNLEYQSITQRLREYRIRQGRMNDIILKPTMVMADMDTMRPAYLLERGQYDAPRERVQPGTPKAVLAFQKQYPNNRLGLAKWLFNPENPLTARVVVNRYWQLIFGQGIVSTPGDFGSQGTLPSHPELLDWLAVDFQASGWDLKRLLKMMVMSATYRQTARTNPNLQRIDPQNVYLARGPQTRLPAEMVRDHALAVSGLLSQEVGGPSVKPYQPKGLWLEVASGNQSLRKYIQDHGHELYRRSLYSFWKRTIPPPSMTVFDAPSREQCTLKRRATSTPMQALVLLNDPQFIEASRLIATRMLMEADNTPEERIRFAFKLTTSREANTDELSSLIKLLQKELEHFQEDHEAAQKLIQIGEYPIPKDFSTNELAAYTVVANTILNLTESIRKG